MRRYFRRLFASGYNREVQHNARQLHLLGLILLTLVVIAVRV